MTRHVVFGTGQVGRLVAEQLHDLGFDVVAVNRSGRPGPHGVPVVAGDATDPAFTTRVCAGAAVVHFCLNASSYGRWTEEFPPLQRGVLAGAAAAGARLVVLDNLYSYGPTAGLDLVETLPPRPTSAKAATRAVMTAELLAAHRAGVVEVAVGRASDFVGPGATTSALGDDVVGSALAGRRVWVVGDPDQPHSYSYTPDVAAGLVTLGTRPGPTGRIWHLSVLAPRTTREVIEELGLLTGHRPRLHAAGPTTLRLAGLVVPGLRELRHTVYQFTDRWVVDDSAFRAAFGARSTPWDEVLPTTLAWFADRRATTRTSGSPR